MDEHFYVKLKNELRGYVLGSQKWLQLEEKRSGREMESSMVVKRYFTFASKCLIKKINKHNQMLVNSRLR